MQCANAEDLTAELDQQHQFLMQVSLIHFKRTERVP